MSVFTAHVQALIRGDDLSPVETQEVFAELRGRVKGELRRRGLLLAPPSYVGFQGPHWDDADTLEELVYDVYLSAFLEPLDALARHLTLKENVDGMIFNNIRFYFNRSMRDHDPIGSRIYNTLATSIEKLRDAGGIFFAGRTPTAELHNETVLTLDPSLDAETPPVGNERIEEIVRTWNDDLMPELVTAMGPGQTKVYQKVGALVLRLSAQNCPVFRFGDMLSALKRDARKRWREVGMQDEDVVFEKEDDGMIRRIKTVQPDGDVARREAVSHLTRCVMRGIDRLDEKEKTRKYLHCLWTYFRDFAHDEREKLPGGRALSELLEIPRDRLTGLKEQLRPIFSGCFSSAFGKPVL